MNAEWGTVLLLAAVCCRSGGAGRQPTVLHAPAADPTALNTLVSQALEADAAGRSADSLYTFDAVVVANARPRLRAPRYAGIGPVGGRVVITEFTSQVQGGFAWARVSYRWYLVAANLSEAGTATFILQKRPEGWRIAHAHSSQLLPWERQSR